MSEPPGWVKNYLGIPFRKRGRTHEGCDCWGFVRLILSEQFGILLPSYDDEYHEGDSEEFLKDVIDRHASDAVQWNRVRDEDRNVGDVVVMRPTVHSCHVGILVTKDVILHCMEKWNVVAERVGYIRLGGTLVGYYRPRQHAQTKPRETAQGD